MNKELTVYNMPENVLFQFSDNSYVWKVQRYSTREGNYNSELPSLYTEVFRQRGDGTVGCDWSGGLIHNPDAIDEEEMVIFSGDMDTTAKFKITMPLTKAPEEIAGQLSIPGRSR